MNRWMGMVAALALGASGCTKAAPAPIYETVPVANRNIVVAVSASGSIQPILTLSVKSKASGEIIEMPVQTGDEVRKGQLLAKIDPRIPQNDLTQAQANLEVAKAQLENATAQLKRAEALYQSQSIAESDYETAKLGYATAKTAVVNAQANLQTAKDAMEDTQVRAPSLGTILELDAVLGTVISSPTHDVGGGTVILKMANLDTVQIQGLVDETDIGKVQPGMPVTIKVDAYPNLDFAGSVLKIEPQAQVQQNVTMFPVLVDIFNRGHLLKPGMNAEVEIHVADRRNVLAIPYAALRTPGDVGSAAQVLGLSPEQVERDLQSQAVSAAARAPAGREGRADSLAAGGQSQDGTFTLPSGRRIILPPGVNAAQVQAAMRKRFTGGTLTPAEQALLRQIFSQRRNGEGSASGGGGQVSPGGRSGVFGGTYIVFALRAGKPTPVQIRTGVTDLDYVEVTSGLTASDSVLLLPSASLVQSQQQFRERFQRVTGGGLPGLQQQSGGGRATGR